MPVLTWTIALVFVIVLAVRLFGRRRDRRSGERRPSRRGAGAGATGAIYDLLNEDKRRAVEIIVEEKAEATDPETADDTIDPHTHR
jgi:hypothetical protein